jgi:hypothetical protein
VINPRQVERKPRIVNPRVARAATHRRIDKKSRARYASISRFSGVLFIVLAFLMGYVVLTSNLTGLSYAVAEAQHERATLQAETMRLDDRISALRSDDRLSALASHLNMHEPQRFALVQYREPSKTDDRQHVAQLPSLAGVVMPAVARPR